MNQRLKFVEVGRSNGIAGVGFGGNILTALSSPSHFKGNERIHVNVFDNFVCAEKDE